MRNTKKGFTLVELLVVIAILAILATVSVVGYTNYINNANNSKAQQELTQLRDYAMAYDLTHDNTGAKDGKVNPTEAQKAIDDCDIEGVELVGNNVTYTVNGKVIAYWDITTGTVTLGAPTAGGEGSGEGSGDNTQTPDPVTISKTASEMNTIAGGSLNGTEIALDDNIKVVFAKGDASTAPSYYDPAIRLYQNGATLTVKGTGMTTIVITLESNTDGDGPIEVTGGTADNTNAPTNYVYTITVNEGVSEVVITTKGTDKNSRLYVADIAVTYTPAE